MADEPETIRVKCVACGGTGIASAHAEPGAPAATVRICQACHGQKMVEVKPGDARWRFGYSNDGPPTVVITHSGSVTVQGPLPDREVLLLADHLPSGSAMDAPAKTGHLVSCFLLLASELSKTRQELERTRTLAERLTKDVAEARMDAASVRLEMKRRFGPEPEDAA